MDFVAHALWSFALFCRTKDKWLAAFFGVLPDFLSFGPHFAASALNGFEFGKPELSSIPEYVFIAYNVTHSLVIFAIVLGLVYLFTKKIFLPLFAWALHILIDIPTHTTDFFPTPYLWPLPTPYINGFSWGNKYFMLLNYTALILVYLFYVFHVHKRIRKKRH